MTGIDGGNAVLVTLILALGDGLGAFALLNGQSVLACLGAHAVLVLGALGLVLLASLLAGENKSLTCLTALTVGLDGKAAHALLDLLGSGLLFLFGLDTIIECS